MRAMKTSGGFTRGRGITESVVSRFVLGMPGCSEITQHFEIFCEESQNGTAWNAGGACDG